MKAEVFEREQYTRWVKFALVGGSGTLVGLLTLYLLTDLLGLNYLVSNLFAFVFSVTNNYAWNSLWTFKQKEGGSGYGRYVGVSLVALGLNTLTLWLFTTAGLWYMTSAVLAIIITLPVNFVMSRRLVWRRRG